MNPKTIYASQPLPPLRSFPDKISVFTGNYRRCRERVLIMATASKVFERIPTHALEHRWAVYVNLSRLEKAVLSTRQLPKFLVQDSQMQWISKRGTTQWEDSENEAEEYLFRFTLHLTLGEEFFYPWGVQSECDPLDGTYDYCLNFFHQAPAPVLPWPGACVRALEMPCDLAEPVVEGVRQAEEAMLSALGLRNPAITALIV